jgi:hypothetical protein
MLHYPQAYPYRRFLGRIGRIVGEARAVREFSGGRRCLDDLYSGIVRPG